MDNTVSVIVSIITVLGFILSVYFFLHGRRRKRFSYYVDSSILIQSEIDTIDGLSVQHNGQSIDSLVVERVALWFSGEGAIKSDEIVKSKPLTLTLEDKSATILDAFIIDETEKTNDFDLKVSPEDVIVRFDYADHGDGLIVGVAHTGKQNSINVDCKIMGGDAPKQLLREKHVSKRTKNIWNKIALVMSGVSTLLLLLMVGWFGVDIFGGIFSVFIPEGSMAILYALWVMLAICAIAMVYLYFGMLSRETKLRIPTKLRKKINEL